MDVNSQVDSGFTALEYELSRLYNLREERARIERQIYAQEERVEQLEQAEPVGAVTER